MRSIDPDRSCRGLTEEEGPSLSSSRGLMYISEWIRDLSCSLFLVRGIKSAEWRLVSIVAGMADFVEGIDNGRGGGLCR
jgi:hypothetical protein